MIRPELLPPGWSGVSRGTPSDPPLRCCPAFRYRMRLAGRPLDSVLPARQFLILQRHLGERIAASLVVADPGLVLASPPPVGPGPDVLRVGQVALDQADQQAADLR